ncbi:MAG: hypothetical protein HZA16_06970 [Nitrospirae bacterium]|nr:hypothetical protein [Nitrospirota bacterium]
MPKRNGGKSAESSAQFLNTIKEWQKLEDDTIEFSSAMMKKTKNPIIRMTMEMIINDSQKHKAMQQLLIDSITKEAVHLNPDELAMLSDELNKHMAAEAKSLRLADEAMRNSETFITRYILSYLIADETKHHNMLSKLNDLKRATVFVT